MKLVPMKNTETQAEEALESTAPDSYPWGLQLSLDEDALEKLGLDISSFEIGEVYSLEAKCKVTSIGQHEREGADASENVGLQITALGLQVKPSSTSSKLYPEDD